MKVIIKILGSLIGVILYPLFWMTEYVLALAAVIVETLENLMEDDNGIR